MTQCHCCGYQLQPRENSACSASRLVQESEGHPALRAECVRGITWPEQHACQNPQATQCLLVTAAAHEFRSHLPCNFGFRSHFYMCLNSSRGYDVNTQAAPKRFGMGLGLDTSCCTKCATFTLPVYIHIVFVHQP